METRDVIKKRNSIRKFKEETINKDELSKLLEAAECASVGHGYYDKMHLTVVQNKEVFDKFNEVIKEDTGKENSLFYSAPTLIVMSTNIEEDLLAGQCVGTMGENMLLMATDLNLGCVYIDTFLESIKKDENALKLLDLPEGFRPIAAIAVGYMDMPSVPKNHKIEVNYI